MAAIALGAGLVGLFMLTRADDKAAADDGEPTAAHVHRRTPCAIDSPLVKKLADAEKVLADRIRERQWSVDWDDFMRHHDLAESQRGKGGMTDAFREYCLAMRPLSETLQRQRHKEEVFQPVWDKVAES